jgi:3-phenylpropionate/cinnamic acid dioxygenase small subunit
MFMLKRKCVGERSSVTKELVQEFFSTTDVINAYRGTSTKIVTLDVILDDEYPCLQKVRTSC